MAPATAPEPAPRPAGGSARVWFRRALWGLLVAALAGVGAVAVYEQIGHDGGDGRRQAAAMPVLPVLGQIPDFILTNRDGRTIRRADLAGGPWIADFIFTRCMSSCPLLTARLARLDRELPARGIRLVSFSVDPAFDTPAVLERFARSFSASGRWLFLTGGESQMRDLTRGGFKLALEPAGAAGNEAILHSTRFVLVDGKGAIREYCQALDPGALSRLAADARSLAALSQVP
jgi:protein SCO1/2